MTTPRTTALPDTETRWGNQHVSYSISPLRTNPWVPGQYVVFLDRVDLDMKCVVSVFRSVSATEVAANAAHLPEFAGALRDTLKAQADALWEETILAKADQIRRRRRGGANPDQLSDDPQDAEVAGQV